jgi:hypothetical protein
MKSLRSVILLSAMLLAGCAGTAPPLLVAVSAVKVPATVRVELKQIDGDIFKLLVWNDSPELMVIDRDRVHLDSRAGAQPRLPGGASSIYNIPAGGAHDLDVRFDLRGLQDLFPGAEIRLELGDALSIHGRPVRVDPIKLEIAGEPGTRTTRARQAEVDARPAHRDALWAVWARAMPANACPSALALLSSDADCGGAACRTGLLFSDGFLKQCEPDAETRLSLLRLRHRWEKEAAGARAPGCADEIVKVAVDPALARSATASCPGESRVERALHEMVRRPPAGSTPPAH